MADLAQIIPTAIGAGAFGWLGSFVLQMVKTRGERQTAASAASVTLEQHTDKFALELISAARADLLSLKAEVDGLRSLQTRVAHFEEALDHISALLASEGPEERKAAERRATAFLNRMRRLAEARGAMRNEAQREQSAAALPADLKGAIDKLDQFP